MTGINTGSDKPKVKHRFNLLVRHFFSVDRGQSVMVSQIGSKARRSNQTRVLVCVIYCIQFTKLQPVFDLNCLTVDPNKERREAVKRKTTQYLKRAEEIFITHLQDNLGKGSSHLGVRQEILSFIFIFI